MIYIYLPINEDLELPEHGIRSTYSQCPFEILMYDNAGLISSGTAFLYMHDDKEYIVTNWHNISGKNFLDKQPVGPTNRLPTYIEAKFSTYIQKGKDEFTTIARRIEIYRNQQPLWLEHPTAGSDYDIVAIPFVKDESIPTFMHNHANRISSIKTPVKPGNTAFIIGYPHNLSIGFGLPIWKSGYVASEPHYDIVLGGQNSKIGGNQGGKKLPAFFIDSLTRSGLSGSPVFVAFTGTWNVKEPYLDVDPGTKEFWESKDIVLHHTSLEFCGIYSGRLPDKEAGAALGICWRESVIEEICDAKIIGQHPHISQA